MLTQSKESGATLSKLSGYFAYLRQHSYYRISIVLCQDVNPSGLPFSLKHCLLAISTTTALARFSTIPEGRTKTLVSSQCSRKNDPRGGHINVAYKC